jgi:hypothetical protein
MFVLVGSLVYFGIKGSSGAGEGGSLVLEFCHKPINTENYAERQQKP